MLGAGELVSIVTQIAMPGQSIRFGVLTMLGSCMLLMVVIEKILVFLCYGYRRNAKKEKHMNDEKNMPKKCEESGMNTNAWKPGYPRLGMSMAFLAFFITRGINERYLGFEGICFQILPVELYQKGNWMTYIGFMSEDFYSTDYFSIIPWFFLFLTGYFLFFSIRQKVCMEKHVSGGILRKAMAFMGRHSLIIYMLHQPLLYVGLYTLINVLSCIKNI